MAELLYRWGRFCARRAWAVVAGWVLVLAAATTAFALNFGGLATSFDIPGTPSSVVTDELASTLPDFGGASGTVVFRTTDGSPLSDEQKAQIAALVDSAAGLPDVAQVVDPFEAEAQRAAQARQLADGRTQLEAARVQLEAGLARLDEGRSQLEASVGLLPPDQAAAARAELDAQQQQLDAARAQLQEQTHALEQGAELFGFAEEIRVVSADGTTAQVNVAFTKPRLELSGEAKEAVVDHFTADAVDGTEVAFSTEISQGVPQVFGVAEAIGVVLAGVVLFVTLGAATAAALPVVTAVTGVGIGVLAALAFSGVVPMMAITPVLGVMLGLAVGLDYALFIVNRHRRQLVRGAEMTESIGLANGTAGNAVVFAGATVAIALLALGVTGIPFLGTMGAVGAACVAIAVLLATSLVPALLGLIGERVLPRRLRGRAPDAEPTAPRPLGRARAVVTAVAAVAGLLVLAIPALDVRLGLPDGSSEPVGSSAHRSYAITEEAFGAGANATLLVTAALPGGLDQAGLTAAQLDVARTLAGTEGAVAVAPIAVSDDASVAAFQVVPAEGPNAESTEALVRALRDLPAPAGGTLGVAGQAAINIDISEALRDVLPDYLGVVVGLSLVILVIVFRSLLVPLVATGGFVLSLAAMLGVVVAVFQWGWLASAFGVASAGPVLSFLPLIFAGILFGLAMDYQLFLASGMREAFVHGAPARVAVVTGFRAARTVVVAAALIMIAVFGGFVFNESTIVRPLGFGLAVGVLLDAFVVRLLLMPAVMHLLGPAAWWLPRWLDRLLPRVDVEGAGLERRHQAAAHHL